MRGVRNVVLGAAIVEDHATNVLGPEVGVAYVVVELPVLDVDPVTGLPLTSP